MSDAAGAVERDAARRGFAVSFDLCAVTTISGTGRDLLCCGFSCARVCQTTPTLTPTTKTENMISRPKAR